MGALEELFGTDTETEGSEELEIKSFLHPAQTQIIATASAQIIIFLIIIVLLWMKYRIN